MVWITSNVHFDNSPDQCCSLHINYRRLKYSQSATYHAEYLHVQVLINYANKYRHSVLLMFSYFSLQGKILCFARIGKSFTRCFFPKCSEDLMEKIISPVIFDTKVYGHLATSRLATKYHLIYALVTQVTGLLDEFYLSNQRS